MPKLRFDGHSDDTFGEYGHTNEDHDNCANGKSIAFRVTAGGESLLVVGDFQGCWTIGVRLTEEGAALPAWPMWFEAEHDYSHALVIDAPEGVRVEFDGKESG